MNRCTTVFILLVACTLAVSQEGGFISGTASAHRVTRTMRLNLYAPSTVTGAPYSAEQFEDVEQTLSDGTHIARHTFMAKKCRDSMGRTRDETPVEMRQGADRMNSPRLVRIYDPVAHLQYVLDPEQKIAHRGELAVRTSGARMRSTQVGVPASAPAASSVGASVTEPGHDWWKSTEQVPSRAASQAPAQVANPGSETVAMAAPARTTAPAQRSAGDEALRPKGKSEDLGTDTVEGISVSGHRTTTTYPTGSQGNDRPFSVVREHWRSSELNLDILSTTNDPRTGTRTFKFVDISRAEPDASLFQPPADYTIKDEAGEFTVAWSLP